jgi:hypothetical protein
MKTGRTKEPASPGTENINKGMYMINRFSLVLVIFTTLILSCQQSVSRGTANKVDVERKNITPVIEPVPTGGIHDRALLLAGMTVSEAYAAQPEIKSLLNRPYYMQHRMKMDAFWKSVEAQRISLIVPWRDQYIGQKVKNRTALYPLSGGDILNFSLIYPQAERYVMIAMEKPGDIPDPAKLTDAQLRGGLISVQQMLGNIAQTGYFFSRLMNQYMNPEQYGIHGTLPTVSVFLVRLGHTIESVEKTCVSDAGELTVMIDRACRLPGYRLRFRDGKTGLHKDLIYISARIEDSLFSPDTPEGKFFRSIGRSSVMLKAAVYLLHSPKYRQSAQYILDNADVVIQDDSGLPYRYFDRNQWDIELYGTFVAPPHMSGIEYYPQPDLAQAFREKSGPLPFEFGYGQVSVSRKSGMIVAYRK